MFTIGIATSRNLKTITNLAMLIALFGGDWTGEGGTRNFQTNGTTTCHIHFFQGWAPGNENIPLFRPILGSKEDFGSRGPPIYLVSEDSWAFLTLAFESTAPTL